MNINGLSQASVIAQIQSAQRSKQSENVAENPPAPAQGAPLTGAARLLSHVHILSAVSVAGPGGGGITISRFDLGTGGLGTSADSAAGASSVTPTPEDRREDSQMLQAALQIASRLGYQPDATDIKLEGTAAVDLKTAVNLLA